MSKKTATAKPSLADMQAHACEASSLMKAMGNEQRLLILCLLVENELSVSDLQAELDLSQSALSQHLAILREAGFVNTRREAQTVFYSLPSGPVKKVMQTLHKIYCE
ncbi:MAG: metalloregulator ArsR/SmtB family transcription factor [Arenimonas sp.]